MTNRTNPTRLYRCADCGFRKTRDEFRVLPCGDRCRTCKGCDERSVKRKASRATVGAWDFTPSEKVCTVCANQSWRVVGPKCRKCGLLYKDEPAVKADTSGRNQSAIARVV